MDKNNPSFSPQNALELFKKSAQNGDAKAMNAIGVMYINGMGTSENPSEAINWFEKSAKAGYPKAWYNWGLAYKNGVGTAQDFKKAYEIFKTGADKHSAPAQYAQGFMLFKGLGVQQNYDEAVTMFKKAATKKSLGGMYMLGLCYRNGYGVNLNIDSAKFWLGRASKGGYSRANDELELAKSENSYTSSSTEKKMFLKNQTDNTTEKPIHYLPKGDIDGNYEGVLIKYDWSGKNIIGKSKLKLELKTRDSILFGTWIQDDTLSTPIKAKLLDTSITFQNTRHKNAERYAGMNVEFLFRNAKLGLIKNKDSVKITGNLQLYAMDTREPEKPMFVSLVRTVENLKTISLKTETNNLLSVDNTIANTTQVQVYPNPFKENLNISFYHSQRGDVQITVYAIGGEKLFHEKRNMPSGKQSISIRPKLAIGSYIIKLVVDNKTSSHLVVKQ